MNITERRSRLLIALGLVPSLSQSEIDLFKTWLEIQPLPADATSHYQVLVPASLDRMAWFVDGPPPEFADLVFDFLEDAQAPPEELDRLDHVLGALENQQLGSWLASSDGGTDGGWILTTTSPVEAALPLLPPSADLEIFRGWLAAHPGLSLLQWVRSIGEPSPVSELTLTLPEEASSLEQLAMVGDLFGRLDLAWLDEAVIAALVEEGAEEPALVAGFTSHGMSRLGVAFGQPPRRLALMLAGLDDEEAHLKMAMLEGTLKVEGPELLRFTVTAAGWQTELLYQL